MWKLTEDQISRIQSYHKDFSNNEVAKDMWINRKTVAKYRATVQKEASNVLSGKEEQMRAKQKLKELSKQDKKKLELLEHYSDKDIQEMLNYIATQIIKRCNKHPGMHIYHPILSLRHQHVLANKHEDSE